MRFWKRCYQKWDEWYQALHIAGFEIKVDIEGQRFVWLPVISLFHRSFRCLWVTGCFIIHYKYNLIPLNEGYVQFEETATNAIMASCLEKLQFEERGR